MLNTRKLVYILPEVCYVAELLPTKKPHSFSIQSFRQINAQFMDDEELIVENVQKLFKKLEPEHYTIVLPDFLFTSTIIDVAGTSESDVREYLVTKLLPSLGLSKDTHQLETFILTQHKGKTKVQLSGLEKSLLGPVYPIAEERGVIVDAICPLSWTLKGVISLEPSLSAVELGQHVYVAQHYIGVEQSIFYPTNEVGNVVETVRTLRGAEPNLQTLYLLTSLETGDEIKTKLKNRIPVQQLADEEAGLDGLPAHLKTAIETAAKTLDIEDYPVPRFTLEKVVEPIAAAEEEVSEEEEELPAPSPLAATITQTSVEIFEESLGDDEVDELPTPAPALPTAATPITMTSTTIELEEVDPAEFNIKSSGFEEEDEMPGQPEDEEEVELVPTQFVDRESAALEDIEEEELSMEDAVVEPTTKPLSEKEDWLDDVEEEEEQEEEEEEQPRPAAPVMSSRPSEPVRQRPVLKNRNSTNSMVKMIGISIAALVITVVVGVGAGLALLKSSENNPSLTQAASPTPKPSPAVQASPSPAAGTATASAAATPALKEKKILVVNATGVSGRAGRIKTALSGAGYKTVDTGNAKGKYEEGNFLLMATQDQAALSQLQKDSTLTLTFGTENKSTEDSANKYDIVLVINE